MAVGMIDFKLESAKFFDGEKFQLVFSAMLAPGAEELSSDISIELYIIGSFQTKKLTLGLDDMLFQDKTNGIYKKSVTLTNIPRGNVGYFLVGKFRGVQEIGRTGNVCENGVLKGNRTLDLSTNILSFEQGFNNEPRTLPIREEMLVFDEELGQIVGTFDIDSAHYFVEHVFVRLAREDLAESESCVGEVSFYGTNDLKHVRFVDTSFVNKTTGTWGYVGFISAKNKERKFLVDFIDKMSWEILTLKGVCDYVEKEDGWEVVSLSWDRNKPFGNSPASSSMPARYASARGTLIAFLAEYEEYFGIVGAFDEAKNLLGEDLVFKEAVDLFFEFCFSLLGICESRTESLSVFEMFPFKLSETIGATTKKGFSK